MKMKANVSIPNTAPDDLHLQRFNKLVAKRRITLQPWQTEVVQQIFRQPRAAGKSLLIDLLHVSDGGYTPATLK